MTEHVQAPCVHTVLDGDIHEAVIMDFTRAGADAYFELFRQLDEAALPGVTTLILMDASRGMLPVTYTFSKFLNSSVGGRKNEFKIASLLNAGVMTGVLNNMMRIFPRANMRLFMPDKREAAIEWLKKS
jgi:hypothetical protein